MSLTGGELNILNGKYGISAPSKSVPVIKLIKTHKPNSNEELLSLIEYHYLNKCDCGIVSKGTIKNFGERLYESQRNEWGTYKYTLGECINWEYNLFVVQSLKGNTMEMKAKKSIMKELPHVEVQEANSYYDEELRIDLEIKYNESIIGIQVKPISYENVRSSIHYMNDYLNSLSGFPVLYLYYEYQSEELIDFHNFIAEIKKYYETSYIHSFD